ncbi:MAG TPA: hypothetical protein VFO93_13530 [Hymenobacter sp.]|uniref:hypothetical protein n=1 Tax=Hymenobacter sp. TaxID=1898978 RepID=UPI002D802FDB|nr:hypothetical protein [Hymenobacter sp.]HET9504556.1 hypothetical protein [Hymenobacter sp.]
MTFYHNGALLVLLLYPASKVKAQPYHPSGGLFVQLKIQLVAQEKSCHINAKRPEAYAPGLLNQSKQIRIKTQSAWRSQAHLRNLFNQFESAVYLPSTSS